MSRPGNFDHLIGTEFPLARSFLSPPGALHLEDILSEEYQTLEPREREGQGGPPFAVLKFACHNTANPTQEGFIRMYVQIPYDGTLRSSRETRALQAESSAEHSEYDALTALNKKKCQAVPELLGYGQERQGPEAYVPNGYITYVAWERVPGSPVESHVFWRDGNRQYRDDVRTAFAVAYKELNPYAWRPVIPTPGNLIYDDVSKTIHIAGFRMPIKGNDEPLSLLTYMSWGLLQHPNTQYWHLDSSDWIW